MKSLVKSKKVAVCLLIVSCLAIGCYGKENNVESAEEFMHQKSIDLTCKIDQLAESNDYIELFAADKEVNKKIAEVGKETYEHPNEIYYIAIPKTYDWMNILDSNVTMEKFAPPIQQVLRKKTIRQLGTWIAGYSGTTQVITTSLLSMDESYIKPKSIKEDTVVVLVYDKYISLVSFIVGEETVEINGSIVYIDKKLGESLYNQTGKKNIVEAICQMGALEYKKEINKKN